MIVAVVIALIAIGGGVAAAVYIRRSGEWGSARMTWLTVALCVAVLAAAVGMNVVQVLYRPSALVIAALVLVFLAVGALFVAIAYSLRRKPLAVVALIGLVIATNLAFMLFAMAVVPQQAWLQDLYASRTAAISESQGFTGLLRGDKALSTDGPLPVETIAEPDPGIWLSYADCMLQERKLATVRTEAELRKLVAPGTKPLGPSAPAMPADAQVTTLTVAGAPALGVTFLAMPPGSSSGAPPIKEKTTLLLAQIRGVDIRLASQDVLKEQEGSGSWAPQTGLTLAELKRIAEGLQPAEPRP